MMNFKNIFLSIFNLLAAFAAVGLFVDFMTKKPTLLANDFQVTYAGPTDRLLKKSPKTKAPRPLTTTTSRPSSNDVQSGHQQLYMTIDAYDGRRLGNLMFNYAALLSTAHRYKMTPIVGSSISLNDKFKTNVTVDDRVMKWKTDKRWKHFHQPRCSYYEPDIEKFDEMGLSRVNVTLYGFFQAWKFFQWDEMNLRRHFRFQNWVINSAKKEFKGSIQEVTFNDNPIKAHLRGVTFVAIHIRRGDIMVPRFSLFGYTIPSAVYFKKAMKYFEIKYKKVHFIVCSDDIDWAKKNIAHFHTNVHFMQGNEEIVDLAIMSMCAHTIITTGTYGWWAAWLANGTTIYYSNWPRKGSPLDKITNKDDYFLPHWLSMG